MKVRDVMERIRLHEIALPEFQREYVWEVEQARQLLESLYKTFPTGSLLFWETTTPPAAKGAQATPQVTGQQQIILDGQQRLTALYLLTQGEPPPYYGLHEIAHDPRGLCFDLVAGAFRLPLSGGERPPSWVPIHECFQGELDTVAIARAVTGVQQGEAVASLVTKCIDNLSRLRGILDYNYPVQTVPVSATLSDAIDVFDRVNSSGTKLTPAELALTHISGKWPEARQTMKALLRQLAEHHVHLDLDFLVRGLAGVVSGRADFAELRRLPAGTIQAGWQRLAQALTAIVPSTLSLAAISSDTQLSSAELLIPLAVYLSRNGGAFPSEQARSRAIYWLYAANMWGRYTSEVDQRLAHDLSIVRSNPDPWRELVDDLVEQRGRIDVRASDLEGCGPERPLYRMVQITLAARGAVDWATELPLAGVPQVRSRPLFIGLPQSDPDEPLQRRRADEIANQVLLVSEPAAPLLHMLPDLAQRQPKLLEQHCIPDDPDLWQAQHLDKFLSARRERIAAAINILMQSLKSAFGSAKRFRSVQELIEAGESAGVEFKSSLWFNVRKGEKDVELAQEVVKTIAAFLNAEGGVLLIGVEDNGNIFGIERDLAYVQGKNADGFERALRDTVKDRIGPEYHGYIRTQFLPVGDKTICLVRVFRSPRPVFCTPRSGGQAAGMTFFVRSGNLTQSMPPSEANSYIAMHWRA